MNILWILFDIYWVYSCWNEDAIKYATLDAIILAPLAICALF